MLKFGIVGFGIMGRLYARIISESGEAELVAVASKSDSSLTLAKEKYGVRVYKSALEMYESDDLDAVYIATPDYLHFEFTKEALVRGINVLLEKPMTMDVGEAEELVEIEKNSRATGTIRFGNRFSPPFLKLKSAVDSGKFGKILSLNARLNDTIYVPTKMISWSSRTTPAWFLMSHLLDLAYYLTGDKPVKVTARGLKGVLTERGIDTYDQITALVQYESGMIGVFETGWVLPESMPSIVDSAWEVIGEKAVSFVNLGDQMLTFAGEKYEKPGTVMVEVDGKIEGYLLYMLDAFIEAVKGKRPNPVPFEDGLLNVKTLAAIHKSIESDRWVEIQ